ncbi:MAG: hypothetical protein Q8P46_15000 [Hyphomicrobiales bacterium]|nr:hypothetical protein [Hyphomicrobiales bacterium]
MAFPNGNGDGKRLEHFAENSWAKIVTRYVMPVLLAIAGFLAVQALNDIRNSTKSLSETVTAIMRQIAAGDRNIERLDGRINLTDRVNEEQDRRLSGHDNRLEAIGRTVWPTRPGTP